MMRNQWMIRRAIGLALAMLLCGFGCQTLHEAGVPGLDIYLKKDPKLVEEEKTHTEQFAINREHASFYWLLANKVSNGMTLPEVEDVFREPGEETTEFKNIKSEGVYQLTDRAYRWGPDNRGFSAIVFFRDGRVVNFRPQDFEGPKTDLED